MRILHVFLSICSLACISVCVQSHSSAYKIKRLREAQAKNPSAPISLDSASFDLFTETPRNYTLIVTLTALGNEHNCVPCK